MPTNHDETLAERYMRELQTELAIYSRMTPEQIGAMAVDLHNALAERDEALAELAALKGGREAVAFVCEASSTHHGCPEGYGDILSEWLPAGTELYTAPPAQASAWADGLPPAGELCEARIPHHTSEGRLMLWCEVEVISHALVQGAVYSWVKEPGTDGGFYAPMMLSFRKIAAPTPGASDGKGGE